MCGLKPADMPYKRLHACSYTIISTRAFNCALSRKSGQNLFIETPWKSPAIQKTSRKISSTGMPLIWLSAANFTDPRIPNRGRIIYLPFIHTVHILVDASGNGVAAVQWLDLRSIEVTH